MKQIVLASASPRRQELIKKLGRPFTVDPSSYEEDMTLDMAPHELARHLSKKKAQSVAKRHTNSLVIGADTIVVFKGRVIGKPLNEGEAYNTLRKLNGQAHQVITGFTIVDTKSSKVLSHSTETVVFFKQSSQDDIDAYVKTGEPLDKAGAYAIQGKGKFLVEEIDGDYDNVVGLPIKDLKEALEHVEKS
jgi:septum formation protein